MKVGDVVRLVPAFKFCESDFKRNQPVKGTVCWVHPKGRYYVVEFPTPGGVIRESFQN